MLNFVMLNNKTPFRKWVNNWLRLKASGLIKVNIIGQ